MAHGTARSLLPLLPGRSLRLRTALVRHLAPGAGLRLRTVPRADFGRKSPERGRSAAARSPHAWL
eukprot:5388974-Alexandrium_andersonii.AAC.1